MSRANRKLVPAPPETERGRSKLPLGTSGGLIGGSAIAVLLILTAVPASATTIGPPFHGAVTFWNHPESQGCSSYKYAQPWEFNFTTGVGGEDTIAKAHSCAKMILGINDYSEACACAQNTLGIKVPIGSGKTSVAVNWSAVYTITGSYSASGSCPTQSVQYINPSNGSYDYNYTYGYCVAADGIFLGGFAAVKDVTNGSYILGGGVWPNAYYTIGNVTSIYYGCYGPAYYGYVYCFNSNYTYNSASSTLSGTFAMGATSWFNYTYVSGHHYLFILFFYGNVIAQAGGYPKASALASLNSATQGNSLSINYIKVK